ncbi:MAG: AI-2E family transporter [Spirochaeta sp.]|nr:AI-2E family transporter [Spirochaeta sp.]
MVDNSKVNTALLLTLAVVAVGSVLRLTGGIVLPFVIALILYFVLAPTVNVLEKLHIPRFVSILIILVLVLSFGFLVGLILYSSIQALLREFPTYQMRLIEILSQAIAQFELPPDILDQLDLTRTTRIYLISLSGNFMTFAGSLTIVLIYLLFLLLEKPFLRNKVRMALNDHTTRKITIVARHITTQIARYLRVKLLVSSLTGIVVYSAFSVIGVDFPFVWAVLTMLFNFIPSIGSIIITVLSITFTVIQFAPDYNPVIAAALAMSISQFLIGNVLDPMLLGDRLNLSPVVILFSLLFWGWLWGIVGMFLAVPLTVAVKIAMENIPGFEPIGILMGTGNVKKPRRIFRRLRTKKSRPV